MATPGRPTGPALDQRRRVAKNQIGRQPKPEKLEGIEVVVFSTKKVTWQSLQARGLFTKTQAAKGGIELEDVPAAQYFMSGWKRLYRAK